MVLAQVLAVWWAGDDLHGVIRLLGTHTGRQAAQLLSSGHRLGASARCWTSLEPHAASGGHLVQSDCRLITCGCFALMAACLLLPSSLLTAECMPQRLDHAFADST